MINSNDTYVDLFSALLLTEIERKRDRVWSFWVVPHPGMDQTAMVKAAQHEFAAYEPLYTVLKEFRKARERL